MNRRDVIAVIPARFHSTRLPGKPLLEIENVPMVVHVLRRAAAAKCVSRALVATDDERVFDAVVRHGGEAVMTDPGHQSGTDRVAEVARTAGYGIVANVQGDEPLIEPEVIDAAIAPLKEDDGLLMSTTKEPIDSIDDVLNPNVVKVVTDERGFALYFTRSPVPYPRVRSGTQVRSAEDAIRSALSGDGSLMASYFKHTGLYVYRREALLELSALPPSGLERIESLEQLRALENGYDIKVVPVSSRSIAVDTEEDLQRVRALFREGRASVSRFPVSA